MRIFLFILTNLAVLLVAGIVLSLLGVNSILDEQGINLNLQSLLIFSAVFGMAGSFVSLLLSKWMAKRATGAVVIENPSNQTERWLVEKVTQHARVAGIQTPEVAIFDSPDPNAFATGARRDAALVAVSTGLLHNMNEGEVDAVLGHEIGHIANGDMITMALLQGVLNTFVIFLSRIIGFVIDRTVFKTERGTGPAFFITSIVAQIALGILASFIVAWFSRQREFRADAEGARLSGRGNMVAALERLKSGAASAQPLPAQLDAFGIAGGSRMMALMASHPPLEERIARLQAQQG